MVFHGHDDYFRWNILCKVINLKTNPALSGVSGIKLIDFPGRRPDNYREPVAGNIIFCFFLFLRTFVIFRSSVQPSWFLMQTRNRTFYLTTEMPAVLLSFWLAAIPSWIRKLPGKIEIWRLPCLIRVQPFCCGGQLYFGGGGDE